LLVHYLYPLFVFSCFLRYIAPYYLYISPLLCLSYYQQLIFLSTLNNAPRNTRGLSFIRELDVLFLAFPVQHQSTICTIPSISSDYVPLFELTPPFPENIQDGAFSKTRSSFVLLAHIPFFSFFFPSCLLVLFRIIQNLGWILSFCLGYSR